MARRVAVGRQANDTSVAEEVVLAVDLDDFVPEIEVAPVEPALGGNVGVDPGFPFALLHDHRRVRDQRVAADMIEMEMRVDDDFDLGRIAADRFQPGADFLPRPVIEREQTGDAGADPTGGVVLAIRMHPGIEQHRALGVFDQVGRDRQMRTALTALHQVAQLPLQPAASKGEEPQAHASLAFAASNSRMFFSRS